MTTLLQNLYSQGKHDSIDPSACEGTEASSPTLKIAKNNIKSKISLGHFLSCRMGRQCFYFDKNQHRKYIPSPKQNYRSTQDNLSSKIKCLRKLVVFLKKTEKPYL